MTDEESTDSDYQSLTEAVKKWIADYPQSAAARISLAQLYANYATFARGTGYADTVANSQWTVYNKRTELAKQTLLEAARLKERDPYWYMVMEAIAQNEGWDKAQARDLLDQAIEFEPGYYHFYRLHAQYLLPQWYGEHGDIPAFATKVTSKLPEESGSILYFQIVSSLACFCQEVSEEMPGISYPKVQEGYTNLVRLYNTTNLIANRFAYFATSFKDQASAREAFASIDQMEEDIWRIKEVFEKSREWANSK
jgi:hypothetical protein